jgi:hypothetical protein
MKRLVIVFLILLWATQLDASFVARHLTQPDFSWSTFELKQLSFKIDVKGLFYQTTIEYEIRLIPTSYPRYPHSGLYEIQWDFYLPNDAVVTYCAMQPPDSVAGHFITAEIVDLTTAEQHYQGSPYSKPRLLLRQRWQRLWNGSLLKSLRMKFSPVSYPINPPRIAPVIKLTYLTPCYPSYNSRRIYLPLNEFNVYRRPTVTIRLFDPDNPASIPSEVTGFRQSLSWTLVNNYWQTTYSEYFYSSVYILSIVPESPTRSYLRTFANNEAQFYQLSVLPPIPPENRKPTNILLAIDDTDEGSNSFDFSSLLNTFEQAVQLSTSSYDSIALFYSGFTTVVYDTAFVPITPEALSAMFTRLRQIEIPKLNTLPQMLKQVVKFFNDHHKAGEIWLFTNARTHSDPPATAIDIIGQSLGIAKYPLAFKIINNDAQYWPYIRINNQIYRGNDYLYENLARLSWGSYVKLRDVSYYDALDLMLDCIAPSATSVEIDPELANGLIYSRFQLNQGRVNFPITMPYYEIGLFDGADPFNLRFFGIVDGDLYAQDVVLNRQSGDTGWQTVATFWYARYVENLLLQPQSYATIKYIEQVSVEKRLLTPYSGFIISGLDGVLAFQSLESEITAVTEPIQPAEVMPEKFKLNAYPNPFNPETTISCDLPSSLNLEKAKIKIFNCLGQLIYRVDIPVISSASKINFHWDGRDDQGQPVASGIYLVTTFIGNLTARLKVTLIR